VRGLSTARACSLQHRGSARAQRYRVRRDSTGPRRHRGQVVLLSTRAAAVRRERAALAAHGTGIDAALGCLPWSGDHAPQDRELSWRVARCGCRALLSTCRLRALHRSLGHHCPPATGGGAMPGSFAPGPTTTVMALTLPVGYRCPASMPSITRRLDAGHRPAASPPISPFLHSCRNPCESSSQSPFSLPMRHRGRRRVWSASWCVFLSDSKQWPENGYFNYRVRTTSRRGPGARHLYTATIRTIPLDFLLE
jgi:hypothetical protein